MNINHILLKLIIGINNSNFSYISASLAVFIVLGFMFRYYNKNYKSMDKIIDSLKNNKLCIDKDHMYTYGTTD